MRLTTDEMRFFKRNGYLIKRGVLDPALMERARARLWDGAPPGRRRDDPDTWVGPFREDEENPDGANHRRGFRWNFREPGGEAWMVRLLATEPKVWAMAEQMLGKGQLVQPQRIRGIYCTLPYGDHPPQALGCHTDGHPFHLGVVGYIDDVPPNGGSFMVWPESHRAFYPTFTSQYLRDQDEAAYEKVRAAFNQRPPVDTHGQAGDIVFWHHRLGHMASPNTSRHLRQAVLYDFLKQDIEQTQQEPPQQDMWRDWSDEMRAIAIEQSYPQMDADGRR